MKKLLIVMTIVCFTAFNAFAIDLSVGGVIDLTPTFDTMKMKIGDNSEQMTTQQVMMGGKAFFDAQYITVTLGLDGTVGKQKQTFKSGGETSSEKIDLNVLYFNIGLLGKYPFTVGIAKLYPMLGFDFDIPMTAKVEGVALSKEFIAENLHRYWFDIGFGADVFVFGKLFVRPQAMLGFQMNKSQVTKDGIKYAKDAGGSASAVTVKFNIGFGVGYQF